MQWKRTFLLSVVASLCIAALLGMGVFLFRSFSQTEAKILGTTLTVALFSLTARGAAFVSERDVRGPSMAVAGACSAAGNRAR